MVVACFRRAELERPFPIEVCVYQRENVFDPLPYELVLRDFDVDWSVQMYFSKILYGANTIPVYSKKASIVAQLHVI